MFGFDHKNLTSLQINIINSTVPFDDIIDSIDERPLSDKEKSELKLRALNALTADEIPANDAKEFANEKLDILGSIEYIRLILKHPCPQNRSYSATLLQPKVINFNEIKNFQSIEKLKATLDSDGIIELVDGRYILKSDILQIRETELEARPHGEAEFRIDFKKIKNFTSADELRKAWANGYTIELLNGRIIQHDDIIDIFDDHVLAKEPLGLISLTNSELDSTRPATKRATVNYIKKIIEFKKELATISNSPFHQKLQNNIGIFDQLLRINGVTIGYLKSLTMKELDSLMHHAGSLERLINEANIKPKDLQNLTEANRTEIYANTKTIVALIKTGFFTLNDWFKFTPELKNFISEDSKTICDYIQKGIFTRKPKEFMLSRSVNDIARHMEQFSTLNQYQLEVIGAVMNNQDFTYPDTAFLHNEIAKIEGFDHADRNLVMENLFVHKMNVKDAIKELRDNEKRIQLMLDIYKEIGAEEYNVLGDEIIHLHIKTGIPLADLKEMKINQPSCFKRLTLLKKYIQNHHKEKFPSFSFDEALQLSEPLAKTLAVAYPLIREKVGNFHTIFQAQGVHGFTQFHHECISLHIKTGIRLALLQKMYAKQQANPQQDTPFDRVKLLVKYLQNHNKGKLPSLTLDEALALSTHETNNLSLGYKMVRARLMSIENCKELTIGEQLYLANVLKLELSKYENCDDDQEIKYVDDILRKLDVHEFLTLVVSPNTTSSQEPTPQEPAPVSSFQFMTQQTNRQPQPLAELLYQRLLQYRRGNEANLTVSSANGTYAIYNELRGTPSISDRNLFFQPLIIEWWMKPISTILPSGQVVVASSTKPGAIRVIDKNQKTILKEFPQLRVVDQLAACQNGMIVASRFVSKHQHTVIHLINPMTGEVKGFDHKSNERLPLVTVNNTIIAADDEDANLVALYDTERNTKSKLNFQFNDKYMLNLIAANDQQICALYTAIGSREKLCMVSQFPELGQDRQSLSYTTIKVPQDDYKAMHVVADKLMLIGKEKIYFCDINNLQCIEVKHQLNKINLSTICANGNLAVMNKKGKINIYNNKGECIRKDLDHQNISSAAALKDYVDFYETNRMDIDYIVNKP